MRIAVLLGLFSSTAVFAQSGYDTPCTTTVTEMIPWGCTVTVGGQMATQTVDCKGCAMTTTSKINGLLGLGPVCIGGRSTMTDAKVIKTVTACALGTEGKAKTHHGGKEEVSTPTITLRYLTHMLISCKRRAFTLLKPMRPVSGYGCGNRLAPQARSRSREENCLQAMNQIQLHIAFTYVCLRT